MYTPFNKRATEYLPDGEAFLNIVAPDFFRSFLGPFAKNGRLFDRLVRLVGTPGSGKTTLAKLLQYENVTIVARRSDSYRALYDFLLDIGVIERVAQKPARVIARLPMESEYRTFWGLPYGDDIKNQLLYAFIQARSVLSWLRQIQQSGVSIENVQPITREHSPAVVAAAGARSGLALLTRAEEVERAVYSIVAGIVPPPQDALPRLAVAAYAPFDALEGVRLGTSDLSFVIILDDFHQLAKAQRFYLTRAFTRRELRIARWTLMRYDALNARSVIANASAEDDELPSDVDPSREIATILMQDSRLLTTFNRLAPKMADQQLQQVSILRNAGLRTLSQALSSGPPRFSERARIELAAANDRFTLQHRISDERASEYKNQLRHLLDNREPEVLEQALSILFHRYVKRVRQPSLISDSDLDPEPNRPIAADNLVLEAARVQLLHKYNRPYYYGAKVLVDGASGNAEQYLRLCDPLVLALESLWIQEHGRELSPEAQHQRLRDLASEYRNGWKFPESTNVRRLTDHIARVALKRTLEDTAPVAPGPNAVAILDLEFSRLFTEPKYERLIQALKYAIAYNALVLKRSGHKGEKWTTLQLNGLLCIDAGLALAQGNYVDRMTLNNLAAVLEPD